MPLTKIKKNVLVAKISQSGTANVTQLTMQNTSPYSYVWTRSGTGTYTVSRNIDGTNITFDSKTVVRIYNRNGSQTSITWTVAINYIQIITANWNGTTWLAADGMLGNTEIEIITYEELPLNYNQHVQAPEEIIT